jgi:LacI family transcriptional regulator
MRPNIARVAEQAGVSKMTVSRVVNGRTNVSAPLRARVEAAVAKLGYVPSDRARSLAVGRSHVVCILVPDTDSEWITPLLLGVGEAAELLGYQVLLRTTGRGQTYRADAPDLLSGSDLADGVIVASWRVPVEFARRAARRGHGIVLIDSYTRPRDVAWVSSTDRAGARDMVRHLSALGHRRIAFIGGGAGPYLARQRLAGFRDGLAEAGLRLDAALVGQGDFTRESGYTRAREMLALPEPPSAIFAANDPMAVGVLQAAHELRLQLPEQLSVAGFDDTLAASASPTLTTIRRDYKEMGRSAMRVLAAAIQAGGAAHPRQEDVPTALVQRQSTAPPGETALLGGRQNRTERFSAVVQLRR